MESRSSSSAVKTAIVNNTKEVLRMKVGHNNHFADLATVAKGQKYTMNVDTNGTYQEFILGVEADGKKVIVTSDDCCDYKCITIKEAESEGKFDVEKVPRHVNNVAAAKKQHFSWKLWRPAT